MLAIDFAAYGLSSVKKLGADRGMIERNDLRSRLGRTSSADPTFETYEPKTDSEYDALMAERRGLPARVTMTASENVRFETKPMLSEVNRVRPLSAKSRPNALAISAPDL